MPVSYDLEAPAGIAPPGRPLPRPASGSPFGWMMGPLGRARDAVFSGAPPLPEAPAATTSTPGWRDMLRTTGDVLGRAYETVRENNARGLETAAVPPAGDFTPLAGGGYATPARPWTGPASPPLPTSPGGPGFGIDTARQFFGAPPQMNDFMRNDIPLTGAPTMGWSARRLDPAYGQAMAAYNTGLNAVLGRTSDMERAGLGAIEMLGVPGESGVPGRLATQARAAEAADRSATSQFGPEAMRGSIFNSVLQANQGDMARTMRSLQGQGVALPQFLTPPGGATGGAPAGVLGPDQTPEAISARVRNALEGARRLSAPFVLPLSRDPRAVTTGSGATAWRGRQREQLLRDAGVPEAVIRHLASGNRLATGSSGIIPGIEGSDPGLSIDDVMRALNTPEGRAAMAAAASPLRP